MADDLSLLFRIRGDAAGAKQATAETRAAVAQLKTSLGGEFNQIQRVGQTALTGVGNSLNNFVTQRIPLVGNALAQLTPQFGELAAESSAAGASIGAIAGPVGIAAGALLALHVAAIAVAKGFFDLVVSTAQWEGKLFDLSQQTGVSVETLSTLSALAEDTGGSIESVAQSLVIFQGNIEDAQDSTSKAGKQFADLGISTDNTEQSLREAIKALAAMDEGLKQTNAAADLFGRRGGKQFLAILKESHGDIDAVEEELRALNSLVTGPVAKGADQLNDKLNATRRQFQGLTAQIVNESMPLIVKALQQLSTILRENRETFILLGQAIGLFLQGNLRLIAPAVTIASLAFDGHRRALAPLVEMYERFAAVLQIVSGRLPSVDPNAIPAVPGPGAAPQFGGAATLGKGITRPKGTGSGKGRSAAKDTALQDATAEAELAERELLQKIEADIFENKRALANHVRDIEEFTRRAIELADQRHRAEIDRINDEWLALQNALAKKLLSQKEYDRKKREIDIQTNDSIRKNQEEISELEDRRDREVAEAELNAHKRSAQLADEASDRLINIIQDRIDRQEIAESEGEKQIAVLLAEGYERRKRLLEDEIDDFGTSLERKKEITDELIRLDGERADSAERAARRIREAQESELPQRPRRVKDATRPRSVEEDEFGKPFGIEENKSAIDQLFGAIEANLGGAERTAALAGLEALTTAFSGLGQAIGTVVEAWVLYGEAGTSIRKVTAQILAQVAAQAAVKAVFELAEGFAALALAFFGVPNAGPSASAHFTAAAIYGSIAAVAAISGRAIAGDAFKQTSGTSGGGSSRGGSSGGGQSAKPGTTDVNRNALAQPTGTLTINLGLKQGIVAEEFRKDYMLNGPTRLIIKTDGQG